MVEEAPPLPDPLPELVVSMFEAIGRATGCNHGKWRIDFTLQDGKWAGWTRQQGPSGRSALADVVNEHA